MKSLDLNTLLSSKPKKQIFLRFWVSFFVFVYLYEKHRRNPKVRAYFKSFRANPRANFDDLFPPLQFLILSSKLANVQKSAVDRTFRFFAKLKMFLVDSIDPDLLSDLVRELKYNSELKPTPRFFKAIDNFLKSFDYEQLYLDLMHQLTKHPELKKEFSEILKILRRLKPSNVQDQQQINIPNLKKVESDVPSTAAEKPDILQLFIKLIGFKIDEKLWRSPFTQFLNFVATGAGIRSVEIPENNIPYGSQFDIWAKKFLDELLKFEIIKEGDLSVSDIKVEFKKIFLENYKNLLKSKSINDSLKQFASELLPYLSDKIDLKMFENENSICSFILYQLISNPEFFENEIFPCLKKSEVYSAIMNYAKNYENQAKHPIILGTIDYLTDKGMADIKKLRRSLTDFLGDDVKFLAKSDDLVEKANEFIEKITSSTDFFYKDLRTIVNETDDPVIKEIGTIIFNRSRLQSVMEEDPHFIFDFIKKLLDKFRFGSLISLIASNSGKIEFEESSTFGRILRLPENIHPNVVKSFFKQVDARYLFLVLLYDEAPLKYVVEKEIDVFIERFSELLPFMEYLDSILQFENLKPSNNGKTIFLAYFLSRFFLNNYEVIETFNKIRNYLEDVKIEKPGEPIEVKSDLIFKPKVFAPLIRSWIYAKGGKDIVKYNYIYDKIEEGKDIIKFEISEKFTFLAIGTMIADVSDFIKSVDGEQLREFLGTSIFVQAVFDYRKYLDDTAIERIKSYLKNLGIILQFEKTNDLDILSEFDIDEWKKTPIYTRVIAKYFAKKEKFISLLMQTNKELLETISSNLFANDFSLTNAPLDVAVLLKNVYSENKDRFSIVIENLVYMIQKYKGLKQGKFYREILKYLVNLINLDPVKAKLFDPKHSKELVPLIEPKTKFLVEALKFNNVLPIKQIRIKRDFTKDDIERIIEKIERSKDFQLVEPKIEPIHLDMEGLAKETEFLSNFLTDDMRHGNIAPIVLKVWKANVEFPEFQEFKAKYPNTVMDPVFHGTGSFAAAFILRYGFRVIKGSLEKAGKMLGDGIYFTNVIDKALQYVGDTGFTRSYATKGYILQMEAVLGEEGKHFRSAGIGTDVIKSPEWCVFNPKAQLKIYKVYLVQIVSRNSMLEFLEKYSARR